MQSKNKLIPVAYLLRITTTKYLRMKNKNLQFVTVRDKINSFRKYNHGIIIPPWVSERNAKKNL